MPAYYADRAKSYLAQLDELDKWIQAEVDNDPQGAAEAGHVP